MVPTSTVCFFKMRANNTSLAHLFEEYDGLVSHDPSLTLFSNISYRSYDHILLFAQSKQLLAISSD